MAMLILIVGLSVLDAIISSQLIEAGMGTEANTICPVWILVNPWLRGLIAFAAALWFNYKCYTWLLWFCALILTCAIIWNGTWYIIWRAFA